jgi:flagellar assembly protein FliH
MPSRVISGAKTVRVEPLNLLLAYGTPVNAQQSDETPANKPSDYHSTHSPELEGAVQRIEILERRVQELEAELIKRFEAGRRTGFAEGETSGAAAARREWEPALERVARTIADLSTYPARFRKHSEPEIVKLSMAVARKILRRELQVDPHALAGVVKALLDTLNSSEVLAVRLAPLDLEWMQASLEKLGLPQAVQLIADKTLARGAVLVETKRGTVDAGIETQLTEITNGFVDRISGERTK